MGDGGSAIWKAVDAAPGRLRVNYKLSSVYGTREIESTGKGRRKRRLIVPRNDEAKAEGERNMAERRGSQISRTGSTEAHRVDLSRSS